MRPPCRSRTKSPRRAAPGGRQSRPACRPRISWLGGSSKSMRISCCWRGHHAQLGGGVLMLGSRRSEWRCRRAAAGFPKRAGQLRRRPPRTAGWPAARAAILRATLPRHRAFFDAGDFGHRHRGFGRDAVDFAEPVAVWHHVADHQGRGRRPNRQAKGRHSSGTGFKQARVQYFLGGQSRGIPARLRARWPGRTYCGRQKWPGCAGEGFEVGEKSGREIPSIR